MFCGGYVAIAETMGIGLGTAALLLGAAGLSLELQYRRRPGNDLELTPGEWQREIKSPQHWQLVGILQFRNLTETLEIMLPQVSADVTLLSDSSLAAIHTRTQVTSLHPDTPARADGYWDAYIVKVGKTTQIQITIDIEGETLTDLQTAWVKIHYLTYGPQGRIPKVQHVVVPLQFPHPQDDPQWREVPEAKAQVLPVKTHLLTNSDDPVEVVNKYVVPHAQPGDIVTIGETPIAIIQGRWRDPSQVKPGFVARRLCYFFLPTSSLATACGLQTLVDLVGPMRVFSAFVGGAVARVFGYRGGFYQLAGEQARLIDDVTGTLPPYDQFIILGPSNPQAVVDKIKQETGISAAIVDVNDLKAVKILAATSDVPCAVLQAALRSNPAGNANEQTPVVLIRPTS
jgi:hypothetical protein